MFYQDGHHEYEKRPVEAPVCQTVDGVRTEDSSCGIKYCLKVGQERAAVLWGQVPGLNFMIECHKDGEDAEIGTKAGGGHPALNFR